jgi:uncharacterized repeat protein (TIGR01451 family)/MYXO-CTERM domain-containing protein
MLRHRSRAFIGRDARRAPARPHSFSLALVALALSGCSGGPEAEAPSRSASSRAMHGAADPVPWPSEPAAAACGATCGQWRPYTRFGQTLNDPRVQDPSNGGTSPQNHVNIASSCTDQALPSVYYYLHQDPTDPTRDVLLFRWRVAQSAHTYATGPNAGASRSSDPWSSALWTVLFDLDGSGYRNLAAHINGSAGSPSSPIDTLAGIYGRIPTQSINYLDDPDNIKLLGHSPTAFIDPAGGGLLNFQNTATPSPLWPNGAAETIWDYGTTRALLVSERPCTEYFIDYQIPVAMLDATAHGGQKVDRSTPISMLFCTANSLNNPFQKDCALNRKWTASENAPGPFGDFISFDQDDPYAQPIIRKVAAVAPSTCAQTYALTALVQDALWVTPQGTIAPSVQEVSFWYYRDANGDGISNDGGDWAWAANATLVPGTLNEWRASWDSRGLPKGSYLVGVQALDDHTRLDDGMTPGGVDNRTFSYVTSDALGRIHSGGTWHIDPAHFPAHAPPRAPAAGESWYGNPLVTGVQVAGTGVDVALNACGVSPSLGMTGAPADLVPGEQVQLAVTVSHPQNPFAVGVTSLSAQLPPGFTYVAGSTSGPFGSGDPVISGGTLTWPLAPAVQIAPGGTATLSFAATAGSDAGHFNAQATATTTLGDISSPMVPLVVYSARASLTQTPDRYVVTPNGTMPVVYTVHYANNSPVTLSGATLTNALVPNVNFVSCTGGGSCALGNGTVTWQLGSLAPGASGSVTLTITVAPAFSGTSLVNQTVLTALPPTGAALQRTASSTIAVAQPAPAFNLAMTSSAPRIDPGTPVTWTLTYANQGTGTASGTLLVDTLPAGFAFASCSVAGNPHFTACTHNTGVVTFHGAGGAGVAVGLGGTGSVTITATAAPAPFTYPNPGTNQATISASGGAGAAQASSTVGVGGQYCTTVNYFRRGTDNLLTTLRPATVQAPTATGAYSTTITTNSGTFTDSSTYPDQIIFRQDEAYAVDTVLSGQQLNVDFALGTTQGGGRTRVILENASTGQVIATSADFQINNSTVPTWYQYSVTVPTPASGPPLSILAGQRLRWVFQFRSGGASTRDIIFHYDTVTYPSRSSFCAAASPPALSVTNSVDKSLVAGPVERLTYTLRYANVGGASASSVELADTLSAGMTACEFSTTGSTWQACSAAASSPPRHDFALGTLASGASGTVFVRGDSPPTATPGQSLVNTATLTSAQTQSISATSTTQVQSVNSGGAPVIAISAAADKGLVGPSEVVTYVLTVVNVGAGAATNLTVSDVLPVTGYFNYVPGSISGGDGRSVVGNGLGWSIGTLPVGAVAVLGFQMASSATGLPSGITPLDTFAEVTDGTYCTGATRPASCTSNTVTVMVDGTARLTLGSSATPATVGPGGLIQYTVTVGSTGSSTASAVTVVDALPAYTRLEAVTAGSGTYDAVNHRLAFALGALPPGAVQVLGFTLRTEAAVPAGTTPLMNVATASASNAQSRTSTVQTAVVAEPVMGIAASGPGSLPAPAARLATAAASSTTVTVQSAALLEVGSHVLVNGTVSVVSGKSGNTLTLATEVTGGPGTPVYRSGAYALTLQNTGNAAASAVTATAVLPVGWHYVASQPAATSAPAVGSDGSVSWDLATFGVGAATTLQLWAVPTATHTLQASVVDSRSCTSGAVSGCADSVTTLVGGLLAHVRTSTPVVSVAPSGGVAEYTITLENTLAVPLGGVSVTDLLPGGFSYRDGSGTPAPSSVAGGVPTWSGLSVPASGTLLLAFEVDVSPDAATGTYDNELLLAAPAGVGVTPFDPLSTTDEDVTVVGAGAFVAAGHVYRDRPTLGARDGDDTGLEGITVTVDDAAGLPPYELHTDSFGFFHKVLPAGAWAVAVPPVASNNALLTGMILYGDYAMPAPITQNDPAAAAITFGFVPVAEAVYTVSTAVAGGVGGAFSAASAIVSHGGSVGFTLTPTPGYTLVAATGCGGTLTGSTFTTGAVTASCTVTATFTLNQYTVSTQVTGGAGGTFSPPSATVDHGETATFTLSADTGYTLQSASGCGGALVGSTFTTGAVTSDCTISATFTLNQYTVTTVVIGGTGGTFSQPSAVVGHGAAATFTVLADTGYTLQSVTGCGGALTGSTFTTGAVVASCTVTATFTLNQYTVSTAVTGGTGGTFSQPSAVVGHGATATFTLLADTGYTLQGVTGCGGSLTGTTFTTGAVTESCTITATFTLNQYTVSTLVTGGTGGTFSQASATVSHGDTASFTLAPDAGYSLQSVSGCGGTLSGTTYTTGAVTEDCTVTAAFGSVPHALAMTVRDPLVNACDESVVELLLVDHLGAPVLPDPLSPVTVSLTASASTGAASIVDADLDSFLRQGTTTVSGRIPASGSATVRVSLDAADTLELSWASPELSAAPSAMTTAQVQFGVGPVDAAKSTLRANGTQLFAGVGSVEVTVVPRDACGLEIGPGQGVVLSSTRGMLTAVQDRGDGSYTSDLSSGPVVCPVDPALIAATVDGVLLDEQAEVAIHCRELDPGSPVTLVPQTGGWRACARQGEFAKVQVLPRDKQGLPLPPGQAVTLVEVPPFIIGGGVEMTLDPSTGAAVYTVLVGSNRCASGAPYPVELRVAGIPLTTGVMLDFACPLVAAGGVTFAAEPSVVPADGSSTADVRITVIDACGNPGFGRPLDLRALGELPVSLSETQVLTADALGTPDDGTARVQVRSAEAGTAGLETRSDGAWHSSATDLLTFVGPGDPEDPGYYLGGNGAFVGCSAAGGQAAPGSALVALLLLGLLVALRRRACPAAARSSVSAIVVSCVVLTGLPAKADPETGFELQQMRPNPELSRGAFVTVSPAALGHREWRAHVLVNYANNPLVLYDSQDQRVAGAVSRQAAVHLLGSLGLWDFLELGVDLPIVVHQAGEAMPAAAAPQIAHAAGLGDLRLLPKAQLLKLRAEGLGATVTAAALVELFLPTGNQEGLRGGDPRIGPRLAVDASFSRGQRIGTNVGYLQRTPRQFGDLHVGGGMGWSVYGETPVAERVALVAEMFGRLGTGAQSRHAHLEGLAGAKAQAFGLNVLGAVGVGFGRAYGTPDWRALVSVQVPMGRREPGRVAPISLAGAELETSPEAPAQPETLNPPSVPEEVAEVSGEVPAPAPAPAPAAVTFDRKLRKLELADSIHFETASAVIAAQSFPLLDEVAALLLAHPEIRSLSIEGHTDDRGGRQYNLNLSRARAASLRDYIIGRGVDPARLEAEGFGLERPVATNATPAGRAKNRRVDFRIAEITWEEEVSRVHDRFEER